MTIGQPLVGFELRAGALTSPTDAPAAGRRDPTAWAHRYLSSLGATIGGPPLATMDDQAGGPERGIPPGTVDLATGLVLAIEVLAARLSGQHRTVAADRGGRTVWAPLLLGSGDWQRPSTPQAAPAGGMVCADLAAGEDRERFTTLCEVIGPIDADQLAAEAQAWRLAVTPYRRRADSLTGPPITGLRWGAPTVGTIAPAGQGSATPAGDPERPLAGVVVIDLSIMWAGPLATRVLADLGATVHRIEPACRADGMRDDPGGLFDHLARGKHHHDLDLRDPAARADFFDLVAGADVVLDAFSPRVRPNLGITRPPLVDARPDLITLSMPAFPEGSPMRAWVAYGTGVHAVSGLGWTGTDHANGTGDGQRDGAGPQAPAVSYPDPIAGLTAALAVVAMLTGRSVAGAAMGDHVEVPLLSAIRPLLAARSSTSSFEDSTRGLGLVVDPADPWFVERYGHG